MKDQKLQENIKNTAKFIKSKVNVHFILKNSISDHKVDFKMFQQNFSKFKNSILVSIF